MFAVQRLSEKDACQYKVVLHLYGRMVGAVQRIPPILRSCYVPVFTSECCTFCSNVQHLKLFSIGNSISSMEEHNACRSNDSNTMEDRTNDVHSPKSGVILMDCKVGVGHQILFDSAMQRKKGITFPPWLTEFPSARWHSLPRRQRKKGSMPSEIAPPPGSMNRSYHHSGNAGKIRLLFLNDEHS